MFKVKYSNMHGKVKGRVALPKCLFHVATQTEEGRYTLIEQPAHGLVKNCIY